jgi:uncharacterized protein (DUF427 family)
MLLRELPPVYFFPEEDVQRAFLSEADRREEEKYGQARYWSVTAGEEKAEEAAWQFEDPPDGVPDLTGRIAFDWDSMDAWFEEDEPITVHPRDPYSRIDILQSSRSVEVRVAGETVAKSDRPVLLFETGAPTRYYLYRSDVRMDFFEPTDLGTGCPYKGVASYFSVRVGEIRKKNVVWTYPYPNRQCTPIQNLLSFYHEKLDEFLVDGVNLSDG